MNLLKGCSEEKEKLISEIEIKIREFFKIDDSIERQEKFFQIISEELSCNDSFNEAAASIVNRLIAEFLSFEGPEVLDSDGYPVDTGTEKEYIEDFCEDSDYAKKILSGQIDTEGDLQKIITKDVADA